MAWDLWQPLHESSKSILMYTCDHSNFKSYNELWDFDVNHGVLMIIQAIRDINIFTFNIPKCHTIIDLYMDNVNNCIMFE